MKQPTARRQLLRRIKLEVLVDRNPVPTFDLKTGKALGLAIPLPMLARADRVIE